VDLRAESAQALVKTILAVLDWAEAGRYLEG